MQITPWNWVWTVVTVMLVICAIPRSTARGRLPLFVCSAAVAAALTWSGVGGSWHLAVFPGFPLLFLAATTSWRKRRAPSVPGAITVPFGKPREIETDVPARSRSQRVALWSPMVWVIAAVTAILLLAAGVTTMWVIALVFPFAALVGVVLRWKNSSTSPDRWRIAVVAAPAVALVAVIAASPDAPVSAPTTTTTAAAPVVTTVRLVEAILVDIQGSVAQPDGTMLIVPVYGAIVTLTGEDTARFARSDEFGHAFYFVDPGTYTVFVEPPDDQWAIMEGCTDRIDDFPVAKTEEWTWVVRMVDIDAATEHGAALPHCDELNEPTRGKGF